MKSADGPMSTPPHAVAPASGRAALSVLFLNSPETPGADTFVHVMLMRGLDRSRFDVHAACSSTDGTSPGSTLAILGSIPNLRIRRSNFGPSLVGRSRVDKAIGLLRSGGPYLGDLIGLARYIRHHRITILHSTDRPRDAVSCVLLGKLTGAKSVVHMHVKCSNWQGRPVHWAMTHADAVVGISQFVVRSMIETGIRAEATHLVLNAIDATAWDYRLDPSLIRKEFGVPPDAPLVVCVARLFHWKGQADLVRALALVRRELPDVRLLIVGEDDRHAMRGTYSEELAALVRDLDLGGHVTLTGKRPDIAAFLAAADVFALPSFEEPFGLVFLEAFAMKKPVVALDNGGTPEVVEHQKSGLLAAPGDLEGLAAHITTLLKNPRLRADMGEYGRRQVETRFAPSRMTSAVEALYERLSSA